MMTRPLRPAARCLALALAAWVAPASAQTPLPAWTRGATCYEVFVRSFVDSDGDGIGDLRGLTAKLDYINDGNPRSRRSLGARCVWLMPVVESPSYHGYDATDYYRVEPDYGTNDDFKRFAAAAHKRGIKVLVDMVLNHTSNEHPWFQAALRDTASPYRAWYRFAPTKPAEKGPWGQEVWHKSPVRDEYYYGVFWSGMPDLNYETPAVREEAKKIARFWLEEMGADGFRLDAVPYLMEDGGRLAGSPGTHALLHEYNAYVHGLRADTYTVGEVYDSIGTMLTYYPDQLDSYFAFETADSIIAGVRKGSARGILPPMLRLQATVPAQRWSPFLRNHDQPRTRTELGGDMSRARVAAFLLLTMPGLPFVYYGEEIGMTGNKPDERLRTPMQWSREHGGGFTRGAPWEPLQPDSLTITVAAEDRDPRSLLNLERRLIHLRAADSALAAGELVALTASDDAVAAYLRRAGDRAVLVVANLADTPRRGVSLTSAANALPPGRWALRSLLGGRPAAALRVGDDGQLRDYVPLGTLAPHAGYLFELAPVGRPARAADGPPASTAVAAEPSRALPDTGRDGPCVHYLGDPLIRLAAVDARSGAPIPRLLLTDFSLNGVSYGGLRGMTAPEHEYRVDVRIDTIACEVVCGFGGVEGVWLFTAHASGYLPRRVEAVAKYAHFSPGCPSRQWGSTAVSISLEPAP